MAIQLIDTVAPDIGLKTVADKLNNNFTNSSHAASRLVGTNSGNVMQVGAFGVGSVGAITASAGPIPDLGSGSDLGALSAGNGIYHATNTAGVLTLNTPFSVLPVGYDPVIRLGGAQASWRGADIYCHTNATRIFYRSKSTAAEWQDWVEFHHTGNILTTTGQSTQYPMTQKATTDAINGISDERDKTEINEIGLGLEVIENINTFSFKLNKRDWYRQEAAKELVEVEEEDGKVTTQEKINDDVLNAPLSDFEENDGSLKRDDVYTGFVAQDLKETLESLDLGHLGVVKNYAEEYEGGEDRFYIEHLALLPFLVNSVKQLSARVKELEDAAK